MLLLHELLPRLKLFIESLIAKNYATTITKSAFVFYVQGFFGLTLIVLVLGYLARSLEVVIPVQKTQYLIFLLILAPLSPVVFEVLNSRQSISEPKNNRLYNK
jgi:hypothetical protein